MGKHVATFTERHRRDGEEVLASVDGVFVRNAPKLEARRGALIATQRRIVFYRKGFFGEFLFELAIGSVTSIERSSELGYHSAIFSSSSGAFEFRSGKGSDLDAVAAAVRSVKGT